MTSSYHNDADDLIEGMSQDNYLSHEPRHEAPQPLPTLRTPLVGETGMLPRVMLEAIEIVDYQDATRSTAEMRAVSTQENKVNANAPVLIVEDTVELAEVLEATLQAMGMNTIVANHGSIALDRLKTQSPRLLLLDLGLPDISGWEVLKTIKENYKQAGKSLPHIIVITAYGDPANRLVGKFQDVDAYLIKPFTPDQVEKLVTDVLAGLKPANHG